MAELIADFMSDEPVILDESDASITAPEHRRTESSETAQLQRERDDQDKFLQRRRVRQLQKRIDANGESRPIRRWSIFCGECWSSTTSGADGQRRRRGAYARG
jgi:hypothetical protein